MELIKEQGDIAVYRVLGVPYVEEVLPDGRDVDQEWFSKSTDFIRKSDGTLYYTEVPLFYDHAENRYVKHTPIGVARFVEETDEGLFYEIELNRAQKYGQFIDRLIRERLLGVSSQPIQSAAKIGKNKHIDVWAGPVELSLTPIPASPTTKIRITEIAKSMGDEALAEFIEIDEPLVGENPLAEAESISVDFDFAKIEEMINQRLDSMAERMAEKFAEIVELISGSRTATEEQVLALKSAVEAQAESLSALAPGIVNALTEKIGETEVEALKKSTREREFEKAPTRPYISSGVPAYAPGKRN